MQRFAETCEAIAATSKRNEKLGLLADYFRTVPPADAAQAAIFLTGRPFPRYEETTLSVGGATLWQALGEFADVEQPQLRVTYLQYGDLGSAAADLLQTRPASGTLTLADLARAFRELSEAPRAKKKFELVRALLDKSTALEAKYIIKIITSDLRIGLKESLVEEAIGLAFDRPLAVVQRANMLSGDIGETLRLAAEGRLESARLHLFHPIGFMLASPAETDEEAMEHFPRGAFVEDKYDGIRAQAHGQGEQVKFFSRTLDEITPQFPELVEPLARMPGDFILDGEVVAWKEGHTLPFNELQRRLGRKKPATSLLEEVPVSFVVFDLLYARGELLLEETLEHRRNILSELLRGVETERLQLARATRVESVEALKECFEQALARGNEGVMVKDPASPYTPGRRGKFWLKRKRPLATLDVVVTAVEYGHGRRRGQLSDYTFAVRDGERLVNIGKAYSGLTDEEIRRMTEFFREHTLEDQGWGRLVEPVVVIEVAFNNIQRSARHESGYALRFPRIVRLRPDKTANEIDTVEQVREIYARQERRSRPFRPSGPSS